MTSDRPLIALYARVSTAAQDPALQLSALREYASRRGVGAVEYIDVGESGGKLSRPKLDAMMADARRRTFGTVVVWKFDRFARSVAHLADTLKEFTALDIAFVSLTEAVDTGTAPGRMLFHVLAAVAEFERDLIRERVTAGLAQAKSDGRRVGRPALQLDRDELLRLRADGLSIREIASTVVATDVRGALKRPSASLVARTLRATGSSGR